MDSQGVYLSRIFLEVFLKPVCPTMVAERFQIHGVKWLVTTFVSWENESIHFYWCPKQNSPPGFCHYHSGEKEPTHFSTKNGFENLFSPAERGRIMELKRWPKLNLRGYWSQVLINSIIFATFALLVPVLLCHNSDSSMLKCEGSLT